MQKRNKQPPLKFDEETEIQSDLTFDEEIYHAISPKVKQFLAEYYGNQIFELQSETYRAVESLTKREMYLFGHSIPDILFRNRTIENLDEFEQALEKYVPSNKPVKWPIHECWFTNDFSDADEEDSYLEDTDPIDLSESELHAKQIIESANEFIDNTQKFADFTKAGYERLNQEVHLFLEKRASFDLEILSARGFEELQAAIYLHLDTLLEDLFSLMPERG